MDGRDAGCVRKPDPHAANGRVFAAGIGAGNTGDGERVGGVGIAARADRHGLGNFAADRAVLGQELGIDAEEASLHFVRVGDEAAGEVIGAACHGGEALAEHAAGGALGDGDGGVPLA